MTASDTTAHALARALVVQHGWNATAYQILNPGFEYWFNSEASAVVGYVRRGKTYLVGGAPVCELEELDAICVEFENKAQQQGYRVCYVCAEERLRSHFALSRTHATVAIGAQPVWNPQSWPSLVARHSSLRGQLNRARNKKVVVTRRRLDETDPDRLQLVIQDWLASRNLPPLHFLVEPPAMDGSVSDRLLLVAEKENAVVALLIASPIPARGGYLIELLARLPDAPNGVSELLIHEAMAVFAAEKCTYVTLGLVALAHASDRELLRNPLWLRSMMLFARVHANRFYNFRGLEQFRVKMQPLRWDCVYAIVNRRRFTPLTLYAVGSAFAGVSPWLAIGIALVKAIREEIKRLI